MRMPHSVMAVLVVACVIAAAPASAQQRAPRFEIAAQTSVLRLSDFALNTPVGVGGRLSFDISRWLTLEGEVDYFPTDKVGTKGSVSSIGELVIANYRRRTDALFGVKIGTRGQRFGVFVRARPGITRLSDRGIVCEGPGCAVVLFQRVDNEYRTEFAFDVGGGMEFHPGGRLVARADIGDTIIRNRSTAPPCPFKACTTHNLSTKFGVGYRF